MSEACGVRVSPCGRFHVDDAGKPLHAARFDEALDFHDDGSGTDLAAVRCGGEAWHIRLDGTPAYAARFRRCFGFYEGRAAVIDTGGWLHIDTSGHPISAARHAFAGNFQSGLAVVCDTEGGYFHVDHAGRPAYASRWRYCGDFREGAAVVQRDDGLHAHIDPRGALLNGLWFEDLDVFHKGLARARDASGWHHVDRSGHPAYRDRFAAVEPFYNGHARVERDDGALVVIDERGACLRKLRSPRRSEFAALSADMAGYWRTHAIAAAVELGLIDWLPAKTDDLAGRAGADSERVRMLLEALGELGLARESDDGTWMPTSRGAYLRSDHPLTLATAALEYRDTLVAGWAALPALVRGATAGQGFFERVATDPAHARAHHRMLRSYALHDYAPLVADLPIRPGDRVFDAAGGDGALAGLVRGSHPGAAVSVGDLAGVEGADDATIARIDFDLFAPWPIRADKVLLARVLHDWDEARCRTILGNAREALEPGGTVLVFEALRAVGDPAGALCGLHLLATTGGRERTMQEFEALFEAAGLQQTGLLSDDGLVSVLMAEVRE